MQHQYKTQIHWQNNMAGAPFEYEKYSRNHVLTIDGKADLSCSSDVVFKGDKSCYNPEDFLLASASSCHMLWYLHLCADQGIKVIEYTDSATGILDTGNGTAGKFVSIILHPTVTIADAIHTELAISLHHEANKKCFIANTLCIAVQHEVTILVAQI
jgi:organic hydroperoxide reductase OsmC/OhrA